MGMVQAQFIVNLLNTGNIDSLTSRNITEDFFPGYENEYRFIKDHLSTYGNIPDVATFYNNFPNFPYITVNESSEYLIKELFNNRKANMMAQSLNKIRELAQLGKIEEAVEVYTHTSEQLLTTSHIQAVDFVEDAQQRLQEFVNRSEDYKNFYIKTGFPELDNLIGGWNRKEELVTIAARTNQGKSWILFKSAIAALEQGLRVGIYEGEMSPEVVGFRMDTLISHISNTGLSRGDKAYQLNYQNFIETIKDKFPNGFCKILTPKDIGGMATVSHLRGFIDMYDLDILFVDQHSLLEDERHGKSPVEKASNISKDLKALQVMKRIPIITAAQQNRASTDGGVDTQHIAQSDRISQDSTIILFFEQDKEQSLLTMHLVKSRASAHYKDLKYAFDFDKGVFSYIATEQDNGVSVDQDRIKQLHAEYEEYDPNEINPF